MAHQIIDHSEFVEGGLIDNVDVEVIESVFSTFNYGGKGNDQACLKMTLKVVGGDGEEHEQYWSVGGQDDFYPTPEGHALMAMGDRVSLNKNSNFAMLMASMEKCGLKKSDYSSDIRVLKGMVWHLNRIPDTRNIERDPVPGEIVDDKKNKRQREIAVCTKIVSLPWEGKGGKKKAAAKATTKAKAAVVEEEEEEETELNDVEALAIKAAIKAVTKADNEELSLEDLPTEAFGAAGKGVDRADRKKIITILADEDFVKAIDGLEVDGDMVRLAG